MTTIWLLLLLVSIVYGFWLQRQQDERAILLAKQLCRQHQLQFLECGRQGHRFSKLNDRRRWFTYYQVDFSSDGESRYQAVLTMQGLRLANFNQPPHRI